MAIDPEEVRRHYASLTDDALLGIDSNDLTPMALKVFEAEVRRRGLSLDEAEDENLTGVDALERHDPEDDPEWIENAFPATTFSDMHSGAVSAAEAQAALLSAGIPCVITEVEIDPTDEAPRASYREYRVMVPGAFSLQATSILDVAIYNREMEEGWKSHFANLTDDEFSTLNIDDICKGLLDRVDRLQRAYKREVARRRKDRA